MEPFKAKKLVMFWYWWRIEVGTNSVVNDIPENFSSMEFGVDIRKLRVWFCLHHAKYFAEIELF